MININNAIFFFFFFNAKIPHFIAQSSSVLSVNLLWLQSMHRLDLLFIVCLKTQASIQVCLQEIPLDLRWDCVVHRCYPWLTGFSGSTWHLSSRFAATEPKPEACKSWLLTLFDGLWSRKLVSKKKSLRTVYLLNNTSRCYIKHCGENTIAAGKLDSTIAIM